MIFRVLIFVVFVQFTYAQDQVTPYIDSLNQEPSLIKKTNRSLHVASLLSNKNWKRAQLYIDIAEKSAQETGNQELLADSYVAIGELYYAKDALDVSLDYYKKAYSIYKSLNHPEQFTLENYLAIVNARVEKTDEALKFFNLVFKHQQKLKDTFALAKAYNNLGNVYLDEHLDSSLYYYNKAYKLAEKLNDNALNFYLHTNLGRLQNKREKPEEAQYHFSKALTTLQPPVTLRNQAWLFNEYATYFQDRNTIDSCIYYATKANMLMDTVAPYSLERLRSLELLYVNHKKLKNYEVATSFFDELNSIRDSINIEEKRINVEKILIEEQFKTREKLRFLEESQDRNTLFIFVLSLVVVVLVLVLILVKYRFQLKNNKIEKELLVAKRKEVAAHLEIKNKELVGKAMTEVHREEIIDEIIEDLKGIQRRAVKKETKHAIENVSKKLVKETNTNIWQEFEVRFEQVHEMFYKNLFKKHPNLTPKDKRLCALLKLNLSTKEIAQLTGQSYKSVENSRTRLRKKLNLTNLKTDLGAYLASFD